MKLVLSQEHTTLTLGQPQHESTSHLGMQWQNTCWDKSLGCLQLALKKSAVFALKLWKPHE
eukprot:5852260-Amphidinium_carterae.1